VTERTALIFRLLPTVCQRHVGIANPQRWFLSSAKDSASRGCQHTKSLKAIGSLWGLEPRIILRKASLPRLLSRKRTQNRLKLHLRRAQNSKLAPKPAQLHTKWKPLVGGLALCRKQCQTCDQKEKHILVEHKPVLGEYTSGSLILHQTTK